MSFNAEIYQTSCALSSVCQQIEEMKVEVGESELLDRVWKTVKALERQCDQYLEESENV